MSRYLRDLHNCFHGGLAPTWLESIVGSQDVEDAPGLNLSWLAHGLVGLDVVCARLLSTTGSDRDTLVTARRRDGRAMLKTRASRPETVHTRGCMGTT